MFVIQKNPHNPLLRPDPNRAWEGLATFNWCPVPDHTDPSITHVVYRALSLSDPLREGPHERSTIGYGQIHNGDYEHIHERRQLIVPEYDWEQYGCEDPRVTFFEGLYYIFYTTLSEYPFTPQGIKLGVAVTKDFKTFEKHPVTTFNSKAMVLFPERINGKVTILFSADTDGNRARMAMVQVDEIEELWNPAFWDAWYQNPNNDITLDILRGEYDHVEIGAPPVKTEYGWLLVYSHIKNFFPNPHGHPRVFGIETILLDLEDPSKILGRTGDSMFAPSEAYEHMGVVNDVVFPEGAHIDEEGYLNIYYGAADTTGCIASVHAETLAKNLHPDFRTEHSFTRGSQNPILEPIAEHPWEDQAVFNPAAIELEGTIYILYRAFSSEHVSTIGLATSSDGLTIDERLPEPIYVPRHDLESQKQPKGFAGCEDPRIVQIDDRLYMTYTGFDSIGPPRVMVTSISVQDFLDRKWERWAMPELITPASIDDKDACIFPEKTKHGYVFFHRINHAICADILPDLDFKREEVNKCIHVLSARPGMWDSVKVGIAGPPIKTEAGWLLFYHGVAHEQSVYRVGACLLDLDDPTIVLARSANPVFEPEVDYEIVGDVNRVVFPCGQVIRDDTVYLYYGGADKVVGVATMSLSTIVESLTRVKKHS